MPICQGLPTPPQRLWSPLHQLRARPRRRGLEREREPVAHVLPQLSSSVPPQLGALSHFRPLQSHFFASCLQLMNMKLVVGTPPEGFAPTPSSPSLSWAAHRSPGGFLSPEAVWVHETRGLCHPQLLSRTRNPCSAAQGCFMMISYLSIQSLAPVF